MTELGATADESFDFDTFDDVLNELRDREWVEHTDLVSGRKYYIAVLTRESRWVQPSVNVWLSNLYNSKPPALAKTPVNVERQFNPI